MAGNSNVEAFDLLMRVLELTKRHIGMALHTHGITYPQGMTLSIICREGEIPMGELAERIVCDPSNVTGLVGRLEAMGYVQRHAHPSDRRVKVLTPTDGGLAVYADILQAGADLGPLGAGLDEGQRQALCELLRAALGDDANDALASSPSRAS